MQQWPYILSNTQTKFEAQFIKKLNKTEAELKKSVAYIKKGVMIAVYTESLIF